MTVAFENDRAGWTTRAARGFEDLARDPVLRRAFLWSLWLVGGFIVLLQATAGGRLGIDAHAYYSAWKHGQLYAAAPEKVDAYLYSPVFAEALWPLTLVPWPLFCAIWLLAVAGVYVWLLWPVPLKWRLPLLLIVLGLETGGNIWAPFALVLIFGFRWPALWAFPALTKVTPVVGPVWFAVRREWRKLGISVAATTLLVAVSVAAAPHLWVQWIHFLSSTHPGGRLASPSSLIPTRLLLAIELPIALGLTVYAARRDRRWLLAVAMAFSNPVLTGQGFLVLAAIPRLRARRTTSTADLNSPSAAVVLRPTSRS